ncbi:MAG: thioredoxin family protein, partial [Nannocystaceae bacterium]
VALNNVMYVSEGEWKTVTNLDEFSEAVAIADEFGKPVVIDFGAEWCNPCKEMDLVTFANERVEGELSERFELIKIKVDNVDEAPDKQVLFNTFVQGSLPGVVVYDSSVRLSDQMDAIRKGTAPDPAFRLNTFTGPDEFLPKIQAVE